MYVQGYKAIKSKMEQKICINCRKVITDKDQACYSKEVCGYICSLDCLTNYAHEYLGCIPISEVKPNDNRKTKESGVEA